MPKRRERLIKEFAELLTKELWNARDGMYCADLARRLADLAIATLKKPRRDER